MADIRVAAAAATWTARGGALFTDIVELLKADEESETLTPLVRDSVTAARVSVEKEMQGAATLVKQLGKIADRIKAANFDTPSASNLELR